MRYIIYCTSFLIAFLVGTPCICALENMRRDDDSKRSDDEERVGLMVAKAKVHRESWTFSDDVCQPRLYRAPGKSFLNSSGSEGSSESSSRSSSPHPQVPSCLLLEPIDASLAQQPACSEKKRRESEEAVCLLGRPRVNPGVRYLKDWTFLEDSRDCRRKPFKGLFSGESDEELSSSNSSQASSRHSSRGSSPVNRSRFLLSQVILGCTLCQENRGKRVFQNPPKSVYSNLNKQRRYSL